MRVTVDDRNEKLGYRIREAQMKKIPYQIVVGDRDIENGTVTVRKSGSKKEQTMALSDALAAFKKEVDEKCLFSAR